MTAEWVAAASIRPDPWRQPPHSPVRCTRAVAADGSVLRFLHNWSWSAAELTAPSVVTDLLSGGEIAAGDAAQLGPWDVRVLVERP